MVSWICFVDHCHNTSWHNIFFENQLMNRRLNMFINLVDSFFSLFPFNSAAVTLQFVSHNFLDYHDPTIGMHWNRFCFRFIWNANFMLINTFCVCLQRIHTNSKPLSMVKRPYWIFLIRPGKWNSLRCETNTCVAVKDSLFVIRYDFRTIFFFFYHFNIIEFLPPLIK